MRALSSTSSPPSTSRSVRAPSRSTLRRIAFIRPVSDELCVSGMTDFGTRPCLCDQGDEHVPLAAVVGDAAEQVRDRAVVDVAVAGLDDRLEEVVRALELVPEHGVVLRELEVLEVHRAHRADAQQVEPGEHPAATGLLLVRDLPVVEQVRHRVVGAGDDRPVERDVLDADLRDRVLRDAVRRVRREVGPERGKVVWGQRVRHTTTLDRTAKARLVTDQVVPLEWCGLFGAVRRRASAAVWFGAVRRARRLRWAPASGRWSVRLVRGCAAYHVGCAGLRASGRAWSCGWCGAVRRTTSAALGSPRRDASPSAGPSRLVRGVPPRVACTLRRRGTPRRPAPAAARAHVRLGGRACRDSVGRDGDGAGRGDQVGLALGSGPLVAAGRGAVVAPSSEGLRPVVPSA